MWRHTHPGSYCFLSSHHLPFHFQSSVSTNVSLTLVVYFGPLQNASQSALFTLNRQNWFEGSVQSYSKATFS